MIGINNPEELKQALLERRGRIVGLLFCPYHNEGDSLSATWPRNFDDWDLHSKYDLDILAAGYSRNFAPVTAAIKVRELDGGMILWFSRKGMYECVDFVREQTNYNWGFSGEFDLIFLAVGESLGIDWHRLATIDVGILLRKEVYPTVERFMAELIEKFKGDMPSDVRKLHRELATLPTIWKFIDKAAPAASKTLIDAAVKLFVTSGAAPH